MEVYKTMSIKRMNREQKVQRYKWRVEGLGKVLGFWSDQMSEPERYGTFNDWLYTENHGEGITELMVEMIELAIEVDPQSVQIWQDMRRSIINLRIKCFEIMKSIHEPFDRPVPTPEEEAAAEAERIEAYRTGGGSLVSEPAAPEPQGTQPEDSGVTGA